MARLRDFAGIEGTDFFAEDRGLQLLLSQLLPAREHQLTFDSLHDCAQRVSGRWNTLAIEGSRPEQAPRLIQEDRVANPVERVEISPYVRQLRREVAELGVLTRVRSETHRFALVYLLAHNGEASVMCPLACTDGLLRVLEAKGPAELYRQYRDRLASLDTPLAGAQFITEQAGGSDVGAIEARARRVGEGTWEITGEKWYCSNPDEFFLVAARPDGAPAGTRGVGIFLVPRVLPDGRTNRLHYRRLKDKLGTRSLPTAEIDFNGALGFAIGDPAEGFQNLMSYVINTSRLHNAANALGFMHRAFLEARNYARQRDAFGEPIIRYPLVQESLLNLLAALWRERALFFRLLALCDAHGTVPGDREQRLWQRCLINMAKYRTAVGLTAYLRDAILIVGANGTVEDFSVLPRLLRDALVIETWEGTHNTLALQILRDIGRFDFVGHWKISIEDVLERWPRDHLACTRQRLESSYRHLMSVLSRKAAEPAWGVAHARRLVDGLAGTLAVAWLAEVQSGHTDALGALLTALAADQLWGTDAERFESVLQRRLGEVALAVIDEAVISAPSFLCEI